MEYMESVKKLEEKLISNQRNHDNGKRNGEVPVHRPPICIQVMGVHMFDQ